MELNYTCNLYKLWLDCVCKRLVEKLSLPQLIIEPHSFPPLLSVSTSVHNSVTHTNKLQLAPYQLPGQDRIPVLDQETNRRRSRLQSDHSLGPVNKFIGSGNLRSFNLAYRIRVTNKRL